MQSARRTRFVGLLLKDPNRSKRKQMRRKYAAAVAT